MKKNITYEQAMSRLDEIARQMEQGETGIDDMAKQLQEAQELTKFCREKLLKAEKNCQTLLDSKENE